MKKLWTWTLALMLCSTITFVGCGGGEGGSEGDDNDPAAATDEEQMEDETGDAE